MSLKAVRTVKPAVELTLAILKPDISRNPDLATAVKKVILDNGFCFVRSRGTQLTTCEAGKFYEEHRGKFFFNRLVTFMTSGPISVHILGRENAIAGWRKLMGPTKVFKAQHEEPNSIRGRYGLTDTRNATHGSDSPISAQREVSFFFRDFDREGWYRDDEMFFREGQLELDLETWIHKVKTPRKLGSING